MKLSSAVLLTLAFPTISALYAKAPGPSIEIDTPQYHIVYSDLVIRGKITRMEVGAAKERDWVPGTKHIPDFEAPVTILHLDVIEILHGDWDEDSITVVVPGCCPEGMKSPLRTTVHVYGVSYNYSLGDEVILSLYYSPGVLGGTYTVGVDRGRYLRRGDYWENQGDLSLVPIDTLRAWARLASLSRIDANSDLVVRGTVEWVSPRNPPGRKDLPTIRMRPIEVWKGRYDEPEIEFRTTLVGGYSLPWFAPTPEMKAGEEWVVFLKRYSDGYHPFMGGKGMFMIVDEKLFSRRKVPYKMDVTALRRIVLGE